MKDRPIEGSGRETGEKTAATPPRRKDFPVESPYYEEQYDPYAVEDVEPTAQDVQDQPSYPEEDWYWREPDNYWLEEGMWPWPEPHPRPKEEAKNPDDSEPPS